MTDGKMPLKKIMYVAMRYDYGRELQGTSFEYNNFYRTLIRMVPEVIEFDFMTIGQKVGWEAMNRALLEQARAEKPDLVFFVLFTDEIRQETLRTLSQEFVTYNWFCDDHWRFSSFSRHYAPCLQYVSTTDRDALPRYARIGYDHVLLTQWACNNFDYIKRDGSAMTIDVSFVGQPHGNRRSVKRYLERSGIKVTAFGQGWENGRISQGEMIRVFNESRINLNLSNSSWNIHSLVRGRQQVKGRNFEVPGCGGFLLTNHIPDLGQYYRIGEEIACFSGRRDLQRQIRYYLAHEEERARVASAGYLRTLRDHTYTKRFNDIFSAMGFVA